MRRLSSALVLPLLPLVFARCNCTEELTELPKPEIEVRDPMSSATNDDPRDGSDGNTPLVIGFGVGEVGTRSARTVEVANKGTDVLKVENVSFAPADPADPICPVPSSAISFASANEQRPVEVAKDGGTHTLSLAFQVTGGSHCRILLIRSNDEDEGTVKVYFTASGQGPRLCAVPDTGGIVDFGTTKPGVGKQRTQRIESCGTRGVTVSSLTVQDSLTPAFHIVSPAAPPSGELPPCTGNNATSCGFDVVMEFNPPLGGLFQGTLNVTTTAATGETVYPFQLTGKGAECNLQVVPSLVQFGAVAANQSATQTVQLRNLGVCHCTVDQLTAITPADVGFSYVSPPTAPFTLPGTDGCDGDAAPTAGMTSIVVLQLKYEPGNRANASSDNAAFHVMSASNTTATDQEVRLEATGGGTPRCELAVDPVLPPTATSSNPFGLSEDQTTYQRYGLIRFGNTTRNITKRMPITLTNRGNANCAVSGWQWQTADTPSHGFGMEDPSGNPLTPGNPGITITPGSTVVIKATYTPAEPNEKWLGAAELDLQARLLHCGFGFPPPTCDGNGVKLVTNAENIDTTAIGGGPGVLSFGFNGASVAPAIDIIPQELDFGVITLGCGSEERDVKIYNTGNADLVIAQFSISPVANPVEFRITAQPPVPATITPGNNIRVKVRFYPRHTGQHAANLVITTDEGNSSYGEYTVPLRGEGTTESHVEDVFRQLTEPLVDVLWVVDDSGSMSDEQTALGTNFPAFFNQTSINNVDYHIAVTTTLTSSDACIPDLTNPNAPCFAEPDTEAGYYTACPGNDHYLSRTSSNPQGQFACNVEVADSSNVTPSRAHSDSAEAGLQAAKLFLSQPNSTTTNAGFLREDAKLYVIMISDEEDQSAGPVDLYVDFFQNLKGFRNRSLVSVSAIAGHVPGGCGEAAEAGTRYKDAVDAIANGLFLDICENDWGNYLTQLAFDSFGLKTQFFLSRNADPAQLTVCIAQDDPVVTPSTACAPVAAAPEGSATGYFYEASTNSIVFNSGSVPQRGQYIKVTYEAACFPLQP
ncbi:MAG: choice-of-anchor D domain-containing protein [Deltaproteobacteria bacterium]|nr:choice-of-anchor D domain-containing protein [Deltaproteobacteria bacterium]